MTHTFAILYQTREPVRSFGNNQLLYHATRTTTRTVRAADLPAAVERLTRDLHRTKSDDTTVTILAAKVYLQSRESWEPVSILAVSPDTFAPPEGGVEKKGG